MPLHGARIVSGDYSISAQNGIMEFLVATRILANVFRGLTHPGGISGKEHYSIYARKWNNENGIMDECPPKME
jgi:hypothetical protein